MFWERVAMSTRKPRGLGAKPALIKISVRVSAETLAYYKQYPSYTHAMREVLEAEVKREQNDDTSNF